MSDKGNGNKILWYFLVGIFAFLFIIALFRTLNGTTPLTFTDILTKVNEAPAFNFIDYSERLYIGGNWTIDFLFGTDIITIKVFEYFRVFLNNVLEIFNVVFYIISLIFNALEFVLWFVVNLFFTTN